MGKKGFLSLLLIVCFVIVAATTAFAAPSSAALAHRPAKAGMLGVGGPGGILY